MGNWVITDGEIGMQAIDETSTVQNHPLGTVRKAKNVAGTFGEGMFQYMLGAASTSVGDLVAFNTATFATKRLLTRDRGPVGVSMSGNIAGQYGWYQTAGIARVIANSASLGAVVYATSTAGAVDAAVISTDVLHNAVFVGAYNSGYAMVSLRNPAMVGVAAVIV